MFAGGLGRAAPGVHAARGERHPPEQRAGRRVQQAQTGRDRVLPGHPPLGQQGGGESGMGRIHVWSGVVFSFNVRV